MTMGRTITLCLAVLVSWTLLALPVSASPLAGNEAAYLGIWSGSETYTAAAGQLHGDVEYAVFGPGDLPAEFLGLIVEGNLWEYDEDLFTYAYQVKNDGTYELSRLVVDLYNQGTNEGAVDLGDTGSGSDIPPDTITLFAWPGVGFVQYNFDDGVPGGEDTTGLVFQSPYEPQLYEALLVDGGSAGTVRVPSAGPPPIPEPSTLLLLVCGLGMILLRVRL